LAPGLPDGLFFKPKMKCYSRIKTYIIVLENKISYPRKKISHLRIKFHT
jgi:hypothetical protein